MYLGNKPADSFTSFAKQDFTTSATTSYTLDYPVANANEIALFINFVRQEPTTAYSATGTSLTLTSATSASDDMYCVFLGKALQTVNPPAGSVGLSQLSATGTKDSTTFLRGDNTFAEAGGGKVLQVISFSSTSGTNTTSTSFVDTALSATITPSSTSNKVFIIVSQNAEMGAGSSGYITLDRNGTNLSNSTGFAVVQLASYSMPCGISYLDSPSSTSALTYKVQIRSGDGTSFNHNSQNPKASITLMEIGA